MTPRRSWIAWVAAAVGCVIVWHPTIFSGFAAVQSDPGDPRFNHYVLEHGYRWLTGAPGHESLWSPGFYHPARNVLAYSDTLLGAAPPYWLLRAVGLGAVPSFQVWQILLGLLNFWVCHRWLRTRFGVGSAAAAMGAFLFAFANPRGAQISHIQLHPQWFTIGAIESSWRLLEGRGGRWAVAAATCVVAQLYAGFYLGWFLAISFLFTGFVTLTLAVTRPRWKAIGLAALGNVRRAWPACALAAGLGALALWPLAAHYLAAAEVVGLRGYGAVDPPTLASWMTAGPENIEGAFAAAALPFIRSAPPGIENELGVGLVTTLLVVAGLGLGLRDRRVPLPLVVTGILWIVLTTLFPYRVHFWRTMFTVLPGARAIRALSRVGLAVAPLGAIGLAVFVDRVARARRPVALRVAALALLALIVPFEQFRRAPSFDRETVEAPVRRLVDEIRRRDCRVFYYVGTGRDVEPWQIHIDAMWAGLLAGGVPTVNGYSGNAPPGWSLHDPTVRAALRDWLNRENVTLPDAWIIE